MVVARARDRATTITLKDLWFDGGRVRFTKISDFYGRAGQAQEHTGLREQPPRDPVGLRPGQRAGDHGSDVPGDGCAGRGHTRRVFSFCFVPPPRGQHFSFCFVPPLAGNKQKGEMVRGDGAQGPLQGLRGRVRPQEVDHQ